jgi:hypothetical protein
VCVRFRLPRNLGVGERAGEGRGGGKYEEDKAGSCSSSPRKCTKTEPVVDSLPLQSNPPTCLCSPRVYIQPCMNTDINVCKTLCKTLVCV